MGTKEKPCGGKSLKTKYGDKSRDWELEGVDWRGGS